MKLLRVCATIFATMCIAESVLAGGLWLNEYADFAGGRATAGASAGTDEPSTIVHNPASAGRNTDNELFVAAAVFIPTVKFEVDQADPRVGDGDGGQAGLTIPAASFAYVQDMDASKWGLGISLAGMAGGGLEYQDDWAGRYQDTEIKLSVLRLAPAVSYDITDALSVGVAPQYFYATLTQKLRTISGQEDGFAKIDGNDSGFAYMVGATYEISPETRIGISYQSEIKIEFDGELELEPADLDVNSDTQLTLAAYVRASLHYDMSDRLGLDVTVGWDNWSALDNIIVSLNTGSNIDLNTTWKDTYHYAAGFQYKVDSDWDLTAGIAYDTSPVKPIYRLPELPMDRQVRYNMGARYKLSDSLTLGGYISYADLGNGKIDAELYSGKYTTNELVSLALFADWKL
jgi:long-chain fatty acid transport protein